MKAPGVFGFSKVIPLIVLAVISAAIANRGIAEDPPPTPPLTFTVKNGSLTLSWPKSATDWLVSTQAVNAKGWSFVPAVKYGTNESNIYLTTALPDKETLYRLVKVPSGLRNKIGQSSQLPTLPQLPKTPQRPAGHPPRPGNSAPPP